MRCRLFAHHPRWDVGERAIRLADDEDLFFTASASSGDRHRLAEARDESDSEYTLRIPDTRQYVSASTGTGKSHLAAALLIQIVALQWINYYGEFYPGVLKRFLWRLDHRIIKWARKKYRSIRGSNKRSAKWFADLRATHPALFAHWAYVYG